MLDMIVKNYYSYNGSKKLPIEINYYIGVKMKDARRMPQFNLRFNESMRDWVKSLAEKNKRSVNSEINIILEKYRSEQEANHA